METKRRHEQVTAIAHERVLRVVPEPGRNPGTPLDLDLVRKVGAVCVYHAFVSAAVTALEGSGIPVAAVSTGFPAGLNPLPQRVDEIRAPVAAGAREIDVVITRAHALAGDWEALYEEI